MAVPRGGHRGWRSSRFRAGSWTRVLLVVSAAGRRRSSTFALVGATGKGNVRRRRDGDGTRGVHRDARATRRHRRGVSADTGRGPEAGAHDIRGTTRRRFAAKEKRRIVLEGLRGEERLAGVVAEREGNPKVYDRWRTAWPRRGSHDGGHEAAHRAKRPNCARSISTQAVADMLLKRRPVRRELPVGGCAAPGTVRSVGQRARPPSRAAACRVHIRSGGRHSKGDCAGATGTRGDRGLTKPSIRRRSDGEADVRGSTDMAWRDGDPRPTHPRIATPSCWPGIGRSRAWRPADGG